MFTPGAPRAHPFKASICEINYNVETEHLEITLKLFTDDLEECIRERTKKPLYLNTEKELPSADLVINEYIQSELRIMLNGKRAALNNKAQLCKIRKKNLIIKMTIKTMQIMIQITEVNNENYKFVWYSWFRHNSRKY